MSQSPVINSVIEVMLNNYNLLFRITAWQLLSPSLIVQVDSTSIITPAVCSPGTGDLLTLGFRLLFDLDWKFHSENPTSSEDDIS